MWTLSIHHKWDACYANVDLCFIIGALLFCFLLLCIFITMYIQGENQQIFQQTAQLRVWYCFLFIYFFHDSLIIKKLIFSNLHFRHKIGCVFSICQQNKTKKYFQLKSKQDQPKTAEKHTVLAFNFFNKSVKWIIQWLIKTVTCFVHEWFNVFKQILWLNYSMTNL